MFRNAFLNISNNVRKRMEGFKFRDFGASIEWDATPGQLDEYMGAWVRMPEMDAAARYSLILKMWRERPWA